MNGLFDLSLARPEFKGYFINVFSGLVYSTKRGPLKQLQGYIPAEHGKTETARCYTMAGFTIKGSDLLALAKQHVGLSPAPLSVSKNAFAEALGLVSRQPAPPLRAQHPAAPKPDPYLSHVERRGFIIGKLNEDGSEVLFGRKPEVYYSTTDVKTKMEELARTAPGTVYVCAKFAGAVKIGDTIWK